MIAPSAVPTAEPSRPSDAHQLAARSARRRRCPGIEADARCAQASSRSTCSVDDRRAAARPGRRARCRRNRTVQTTKPTPARRDDREPPAAADRQHPAEQARAAVEHRGEDHAGEDQQQRLGEHDHADDGEDERRSRRWRASAPRGRSGSRSSIGPGLLGLARGRSPAHRGGSSAGAVAAAPRSGRSEVPARPPRKAVNQLSGFQ